MSSGGHGGGGLPLLGSINHFFHSLHADYGISVPNLALWLPFVLANIFFLFLSPEQTLKNWSLLLLLSPIWLPVILGKAAWDRWILVKRLEYHSSVEYVLLEIRVPRDTRKTPVAMELFFKNLNVGPGESTWWKKWILGRTRPWYSFELVSIEGRVHFCVWTRANMRKYIETYLYAQYPGIEIIEIPDYLRMVDEKSHSNKMWGCEFKLKMPDPYPLTTYVDYGLDKPEKPEEQIDPLSQVIEMLGSLGKGERLVVQIIIRFSKNEKYEGRLNKSGKKYTIYDEGVELVERIRKDTVGETEYVDANGVKQKSKSFPNPTKGQMEGMASIERNVSKGMYDVGIRAIYIADKDHYVPNIGVYVSQMWKPFNGWNSFETDSTKWSDQFHEFPWEDRGGHHYEHEMHKLMDVARKRAYFHYPYVNNYMMLNTEVLASLFHIPSSSVTAPNLPRITSATRQAPTDLPI